MRARGNPFDRTNQELKNAFLDESLVSSSKGTKVMAVESWHTFHDFEFLYAHIRDNRFENNAKFVKTSKL